MTADRHFDDVLAELAPYLDNPPLLDSPEQLRLDQLIAEVARLAALGQERHHAERMAEVEKIVRRRHAERRGQATSS